MGEVVEEEEELYKADEPVTKKEFCDVCRFQAYYMVVFESGTLFFCRHHYNKYEADFYEIAIDVVDESDLLTP